MQLITDTPTLEQFCARLSEHPYITIDTEFMRERTFWAKLCLIQAASEEEAAAIDVLSPDLDLTPFLELLNEGTPLKVFHAARQDLEIFYKLSNQLPNKIFDTQVAAMVCGFGDSVGYQTLVRQFTDADVDKSARFTDWSRRPLSDRQIQYALSDVTHLRTIYRGLKDQLGDNGRLNWIDEEMKVLVSPSTYDIDPQAAWKRIKHRSRDVKFLGRLQALAAWRETEAQTRDLPRNRIVRDEALMEMAAHPPKNAKDLAKVRGISDKFANGPLAKTLFSALENATPIDKSHLAKKFDRSHTPNNSSLSDMLKLLLKIKAKETGVAQKLIATNDEVERFAMNDHQDLAIMKGWRKEIFGEDAEKLKEGKLAFRMDDGNILFFDV
ncbi:MAG: ribonuclease D [Sphingomonadales bacterium]